MKHDLVGTGRMKGERRRLTDLVRARSGVGGHALEDPDADRFAATMTLLPDPPASVLDVGCGTGVLVDVAAELGFTALGIDSDEGAMTEMVQPHLVGSIADLPFDDGSYDVVILNEILEHLPLEVYERALSEVARVARHRVIVTVPNAESLESASARCRQCGCVYSIHGHVRRFDKRDMLHLFPGFDLSSLDAVGPHKLRHRTVEWYLRRRLLGRWPAQAGSTCPQCGYRQPGGAAPSGRSSPPLIRALRWAYAVPWQRWWMVCRYDRIQLTRR